MKRWTLEEDAKLLELAPTHTLRQLSDVFGRPKQCVWDRARRVGVEPQRSRFQMDATEEAAIRAEYSKPFPDLQALADRLGKLKSNVCRTARALGLTSYSRRKRPKIGHVPKNERPPIYATEDERRAAMSAQTKRRWMEQGHPRGMLGKRHTAATIARVSESSKAMWADPDSFHNTPEYRQQLSDRAVSLVASGKWRGGGWSRCRGGHREDIGIFVRSAWEANYARHLNALVALGELRSWRYEARTFVFQNTKRGTRCYTPDFEVTLLDGSVEWHEVKGWMDEPSKRRLAKMAECYPDERVVLRDAEWFKANRGALKACAGYER